MSRSSPLNVLQVLHEERFQPSPWQRSAPAMGQHGGAIPIRPRWRLAGRRRMHLHRGSCLGIPVREPSTASSHDLCFISVGRRSTAIEHTIFHVMECESLASIWLSGTRDDLQAVVVELMIGYSNKRMVAAPIVPSQHSLRHVLRTTKPQDTLHVASMEFLRLRLVSTILASHSTEEPSWWKLPTVANDNDLSGSWRAHQGHRLVALDSPRRSIEGRSLSPPAPSTGATEIGLIMNTGLTACTGLSRLCKKPSYRQMPAFLLHFASYNSNLANIAPVCGKALEMRRSYFMTRNIDPALYPGP